ncbi:UDP-2,4-diacetamido-2,4,6-trideoxy-beta-L-altropyranose hydrolase [Dendrosporobacter sp. 1207_IL3150]|uniref:UDP-2,4-diacetamido-2,4, 6-trideoxy-beta-L-altropyranose hydrolase n=1 Tax=Dendrosporobacter sp. 1207_IL3150 TaxID=3084054 RepID=UPI002FDA642D
MNVVFRTDASTAIGIGHIMRCITLATELRHSNIHSSFICSEMRGNLCGYLESQGFEVNRIAGTDSELGWSETFINQDACQTNQILQLKEAVDWLIVDHYELDARWERKVQHYVRNIMVIDDLANRIHDCKILLDQNLYHNLETRYEGLVPTDCKMLLGPKYALLRQEFRDKRARLRIRDGKVSRILIFFGGSDPTNETEKALLAVMNMRLSNIVVDVVVGAANQNTNKVKDMCSGHKNIKLHFQVANMAELILQADLAIGAGGTSTWERCFLGLPTITIIVAPNQEEVTKAVDAVGAIWSLGSSHNVSVGDISLAIEKALQKPSTLIQLSQKSLELMGENNGFGLREIIRLLKDG